MCTLSIELHFNDLSSKGVPFLMWNNASNNAKVSNLIDRNGFYKRVMQRSTLSIIKIQWTLLKIAFIKINIPNNSLKTISQILKTRNL